MLRKFLLWLANMIVGGATLLSSVALLPSQSGGVRAIFPALVVWIFALVVGVLLSAPFFLDPPESGADWTLTLPIWIWFFVIVFRMVSWLGFMILRLVWLGIHQVRIAVRQTP